MAHHLKYQLSCYSLILIIKIYIVILNIYNFVNINQCIILFFMKNFSELSIIYNVW